MIRCAVFQRSARKLLERVACRSDRFIDAREDAVASREPRTAYRRAATLLTSASTWATTSRIRDSLMCIFQSWLSDSLDYRWTAVRPSLHGAGFPSFWRA